jgi:hypothetical protein
MSDFVILETADAHWTFAETEAVAHDKIAALLAEDGPKWAHAVVMLYDDYLAQHDARYLNAPIQVISEEAFDEALGCLPPLQWHTTPDGVNVFCCSEFTSGRITAQYGRRNGEYRMRNVSFNDRATYLKASDFEPQR